MSKTIQLGTLAGLELAARPSALAGYLLLGLGLGMLGAFGPGLPAAQAVVFGAACALLHFGGELWHNLGHAAAARRAGYPMLGVTFWGLLATSRYPENEGQPPAGVHIQRALGGPLGSVILTVLAGLILLAVKDTPPWRQRSAGSFSWIICWYSAWAPFCPWALPMAAPFSTG